MKFLDAKEEKEAAGSSPTVDDKDAEAFCPKEAPAVTIERAVARREQAGHQRAEDATDTMNGAGTNRVVDMQHMVDELDGKDQNRSADKANEDSPKGRDEVAACRNAHKTCQYAVQRQGERGLLVLQPGYKHRGGTSGSCGEVGRQKDVTDGLSVDGSAGSQL